MKTIQRDEADSENGDPSEDYQAVSQHGYATTPRVTFPERLVPGALTTCPCRRAPRKPWPSCRMRDKRSSIFAPSPKVSLLLRLFCRSSRRHLPDGRWHRRYRSTSRWLLDTPRLLPVALLLPHIRCRGLGGRSIPRVRKALLFWPLRLNPGNHATGNRLPLPLRLSSDQGRSCCLSLYRPEHRRADSRRREIQHDPLAHNLSGNEGFHRVIDMALRRLEKMVALTAIFVR